MSADGVREGRDRGAVRSRPIEARMALGGGASPVVSLALSGFRWVAIERERESKPESERESKPESERERVSQRALSGFRWVARWRFSCLARSALSHCSRPLSFSRPRRALLTLPVSSPTSLSPCPAVDSLWLRAHVPFKLGRTCPLG